MDNFALESGLTFPEQYYLLNARPRKGLRLLQRGMLRHLYAFEFFIGGRVSPTHNAGYIFGQHVLRDNKVDSEYIMRNPHLQAGAKHIQKTETFGYDSFGSGKTKKLQRYVQQVLQDKGFLTKSNDFTSEGAALIAELKERYRTYFMDTVPSPAEGVYLRLAHSTSGYSEYQGDWVPFYDDEYGRVPKDKHILWGPAAATEIESVARKLALRTSYDPPANTV